MKNAGTVVVCLLVVVMVLTFIPEITESQSQKPLDERVAELETRMADIEATVRRLKNRIGTPTSESEQVNEKNERPVSEGENFVKEGVMKLNNVRLEEVSFGKKIIGIAENISGKTLGTVLIKFNLYDSSGVQVGNTAATVSDFEAGKKWKFKASMFQEDVASFELKEIITY